VFAMAVQLMTDGQLSRLELVVDATDKLDAA
jgi:hypothetical protein